MCQNRQALIFCQLSHRSTVPTMEGYYHVTMLSVPTVLPCHRSDSVIIPQYFCSIPSQGRPPNSPKKHRFKEHRSDKETVPTLIPRYREIILTIPSCESGIMPVQNYSERDIMLTRCGEGMKTGGLEQKPFQRYDTPSVSTVPK